MIPSFSAAKRLALCFALLCSLLVPATQAAQIRSVSFTNTWRYLDSGTNLGTSWRDLGFDDQSWPQAPAVFSIDPLENVLGVAPIRTSLRRFINGTSAPQVTNFYFRTHFNFPNPPEGVTLVLSNAIDDGAVFYLNGAEVGRLGMPAAPTPILATTFAIRADEVSGHGIEIIQLPATNVVQGDNVLAVELHQGSSGSSDAVFSLALTANLPFGPIDIIAQPQDRNLATGDPFTLTVEASGAQPIAFQWYKDGNLLPQAITNRYAVMAAALSDAGNYTVQVSNSFGNVTSRVALVRVALRPLVEITNLWRYHALGHDLGTAWSAFDFDDSGWTVGRGVLGREVAVLPAPIRTTLPLTTTNGIPIITYYFRTTFVWTNQNLAASFICSNLIDDGIVLYLNGTELYRLGMPAGPIMAADFANRVVEDAIFESIEFTPENLRLGTNVLAAEVHQLNDISTDVVFGASLAGVGTSGSELQFTRHPTNLIVFEGQGSAAFSVSLVAPGPFELQWFKNGTALVGETSARLDLGASSLGQAGLYHVRASSGTNQVESHRAQLLVVPAYQNLTTLVPFDHEWYFLQTGIYPGAGWTNAGFDVSAWQQGPGVFSSVANRTPVPTLTPLSLVDSEGAALGRHYFRTSFHSPVAAVVNLLFTNLLDDGVILFLNGTEIQRVRVDAGPVELPILTTNSPTAGAFGEVLHLANQLLRAGENILCAVLIHPRAFAGDAVFGAEVHAYPIGDEPLVITRQPVGQIVPVGIAHRLSVRVFGTPPFSYQWYKDNLAITGATNQDLPVDTITTNSSGLYFAIVSNALTNVQTETAEVIVSDEIVPIITLLRGPYLQSGSTTNILVRWRTDQLCRSAVSFGTNQLSLDSLAVNNTFVTNHEVRLDNLLPNSRYYYSVGTTLSNLSGGNDHYFTTAPISAKPTRIWALGDCGTGGAQAASVAQAYYAFAADRPPDVWLMLGDNAYYEGYDREYQRGVFDMYPGMLRRAALWSTIGNHETYSADPTGHFPYLDIFSFPTLGEAGGIASGTEHYYAFDYGNIHFVCLDSEVSNRTPNGAMLTWLQEDLAANDKDWLIAFWHSPPYTYGTHDSDSVLDSGGRMVDMRQYALPILEFFGVDLVLCGHSHVYERSFLLNGHYDFSSKLTPAMVLDAGSGRPGDTGAYRKADLGPAPHQGAVYIVAGSSGQTGYSNAVHRAMFVDIPALGSVVIDVNGAQLDAAFLRENGKVEDHFTILKGAGPEEFRIVRFQHAARTIAAWKSVAGEEYRVEASSSLQPASWSPVSGWIRATGATTYWTNGLPAEPSPSFYRIEKK